MSKIRNGGLDQYIKAVKGLTLERVRAFTLCTWQSYKYASVA